MADQLIGLAGARGRHRVGARGVGPHIGAPLLLGHGHAEGCTGLVGDPHVARVILSGKNLRQPLPGKVWLQLQGRDAGKGHGQGATAAGFGLRMQVGHRGTGHMGALTRVRPGQRGQAMLDGRTHQLVVGRMELHQVDAVAVTVMAIENRFVLVGQEPGSHQRAASQRTVSVDSLFGPAGAIAPRPFLQWQIDAVEVHAIQRWWLVGDLMGLRKLVQVHGRAP
ncbi:hypothetical protein D9M71_288080 [compost metagenome]